MPRSCRLFPWQEHQSTCGFLQSFPPPISQFPENLGLWQLHVDKENAQNLYNKIDKLYDDINKEFYITLEKVKKLKVDIMKSIIEKDYEELQKISNIAQELKSKFI